MKPLIPYDVLFVGFAIITVIGLAIWFVYEVVQCFHTSDKPLPKPEPGCIDKGPAESWEAGDGHVRTP